MMICIFLHLLLVFCFSPPNISKRFCCWQLFWKAIETRPRRLLVFILGLIQISVTFYAGKNYFFQQVQWLTRWLNLRCCSRILIEVLVSWLRRLLVGLKRMVGYGWKVCWMGVILFWLMMTNSFIVVERRIALCWKSGWLGLRDWLVGVERLVGWGWEIGLLELRDWLVGFQRLVVCGWEIGWLGLRDLLVGVEGLVWWGWEEGWLGLRGRLVWVERLVCWDWEIGWLGLRDWFGGVDRLVWWGWEIGLLELRDWLVGVER